ncbi:hypothetical protein AXA44_01105 [Rhodococcus sp. SC4]|nr:hypothetical protein AXA44_01105 [Rhodococcus sp. SC4]
MASPDFRGSTGSTGISDDDRAPVRDQTAGADFDHHSPELTEPAIWDRYAEMSSGCPVSHTNAHGGYWVITGFDEVRTALRDPETFSSAAGIRVPTVGEGRSIPIDFDGPLHAKYRQVMTRAITPQKVREMQPYLRELIADLLGRMVAAGGGDFVAEVALPLPLRVLTQVVGFSAETVDRLHVLTEQQWKVISDVSLDEARRDLRALMDEEIARHRVDRPDDYLTWLLGAEVDDRNLADDEIARILLTLAIAGHETTANASSNLVYTLATDPGLQQTLRSDVSQAAAFVEEILRHRAPAQMFGRTTTTEIELAGVSIPRGEHVLLAYGAANRDARQFADPQRFDPDRGRVGHLAFGWGVHQCLGSALARSELLILLQTLSDLPPFTLAGNAEFGSLAGGIHFGPNYLPLAFE